MKSRIKYTKTYLGKFQKLEEIVIKAKKILSRRLKDFTSWTEDYFSYK